ncbi:MAG: hypothetical protein M3518_03625 [Actinomycetota bacterium]|nr:hypothetical protein [Actinomycetota bacterium]
MSPGFVLPSRASGHKPDRRWLDAVFTGLHLALATIAQAPISTDPPGRVRRCTPRARLLSLALNCSGV